MTESSALQNHLDEIALLYENDVFNRILVGKTGEIIAPRVQGKSLLEMGCSRLTMSKMLAASAARMEIVEGALSFADLAREALPGVPVYHSLFEDFVPNKRYDAIVLGNTLHHIQDPQLLLAKIRGWLAPGGRFHVTVPNMYSLHRRMGVKMGMLKDVFGTTERNALFDQPGRFTKQKLVELLEKSGFTVTESFGFFLKPFSDAQMESLNLPDEAIAALFELGKEFEDLACQVYAEATPTEP